LIFHGDRLDQGALDLFKRVRQPFSNLDFPTDDVDVVPLLVDADHPPIDRLDFK
jgi:hypothetical protein